MSGGILGKSEPPAEPIRIYRAPMSTASKACSPVGAEQVVAYRMVEQG
jgi:hypothetical protein